MLNNFISNSNKDIKLKNVIIYRVFYMPFINAIKILVAFSIIIAICNAHLYLHLSKVSDYEIHKSIDYYNFLFSLNHLFVFFFHQWYIFFFSIISIFISYSYFLGKSSFICPHCLRSIFFISISNFTCPLCKTSNHSRFDLLFKCSSCHEQIEHLKCTHCNKPVNLLEKYDERILKSKRRENAKIELSFNHGLREIYNRDRRLSKFICKHCIKTIIVKNLNITCPFCNAQYLVTDNQTQKQLGDVKIKNYRNLVDESTMEKVLFDSCPVCGGIIESIDCYHEGCKKEINLFENYNEEELIKRRYEEI